eukprot:12428209-Karenia_brevis.AAC.1
MSVLLCFALLCLAVHCTASPYAQATSALVNRCFARTPVDTYPGLGTLATSNPGRGAFGSWD